MIGQECIDHLNRVPQKEFKKFFLWGTLFKIKFAVKTTSPQKYLGAPKLTSIALVKFMRVPFLHSATPLENGE